MALPPQRTWVAGTNGSNAGTLAATGDYSSAATDFYVAPTGPEAIKVTRVIFGIISGNQTDITKYGNLASLAVGIDVLISDGTEEVSLTPLKLKNLGEIKLLCYDADINDYGAATDVVTAARWTFERMGGALILKPKYNHRLIFRCNDDFSTLSDHRFTCQGEISGYVDIN